MSNEKNVSLDTPMTELGFSLATVARFKLEHIEHWGDLVCREEKITAAAFAPGVFILPNKKEISIDALTMTGNLRSILKRMKYHTIGDILTKSLNNVLAAGYEGWKMHLIVNLIDLGYTIQDGPLLNQHYFAEEIRHMKLYRIILGMDERGLLSKKFKLWFNEAIKGKVYNTDNRPSRKFKIGPFKID